MWSLILQIQSLICNAEIQKAQKTTRFFYICQFKPKLSYYDVICSFYLSHLMKMFICFTVKNIKVFDHGTLLQIRNIQSRCHIISPKQKNPNLTPRVFKKGLGSYIKCLYLRYCQASITSAAVTFYCLRSTSDLLSCLKNVGRKAVLVQGVLHKAP